MTVLTDEPPPPQLLPPLGTRLSPALAELLHRFPMSPLDTTLGRATSRHTLSQSGQVGAHGPRWGPGSLCLHPPTKSPPESAPGHPAPQTSQHCALLTGGNFMFCKDESSEYVGAVSHSHQPLVTPAQPRGRAVPKAHRVARTPEEGPRLPPRRHNAETPDGTAETRSEKQMLQHLPSESPTSVSPPQ